jgi:type II secretory pathway pseudopilin PulG
MRRFAFTTLSRNSGFTLVEMLVALLFTGLLMAGMARIYQGSLGVFKTTAERISSGRKGRLALDIMGDDLDRAGMFLSNFRDYPVLSAANPGFYIIPNVPVDLGDGTSHTSDELYFYLDDALPFQGTIVSPPSGINNINQAVADGSAAPVTSGNATTFTVNFPDPAFVNFITPGVLVLFSAQADHPYPITNIIPGGAGSSQVTFSLAQVDDGNSGMLNASVQAGANTVVYFMQPSQMVRYYLAAQSLDPSNPANLTPCLMRDQGAYNPGGFVGAAPQIVAEDVLQVKAYLSANGGQTWAGLGLPSTTTGFSSGWSNGIVPQINSQLASYGQNDVADISQVNCWFRKVPCLIRLDITTRTSTQRTEYSKTSTTALAYGTQTRTLVIVPRHFGLAYKSA